MKISNITNGFQVSPGLYTAGKIKKYSQKEEKLCTQKYFSLDFLSFQGGINLDIFRRGKNFEDFLKKEGKVTLQEYKEIKREHPYIINKAKVYFEKIKKEKYLRITPNIALKAALIYKRYLNDEYGAKNYRIISVGTSPAFITQIMSQIGCDVIFAPASSVPSTYEPMKNEKLAQLSRYIKRNPIDDKKANVIMDFVATGATVETMQLLLYHTFHMPYKRLNVLPIDYETLHDAEQNKGDIYLNKRDVNELIFDISDQYVSCLSNVPHFPVIDKTGNQDLKMSNDRKQFRIFNTFSQGLARVFTLLSLDELYKLKILQK